VDLVPFKTCTYDCVYCQLGRTTNKTMERKEWFFLDNILAEIKEKLSTEPDYITLSGSGEPTLYSRLGELIEGIRSMTCIPVAVLTNGSLFLDAEVRRELACAHRVAPSLDAGNATMFQAVNRPHPGIEFGAMVEGLAQFRREFSGSIWLEIFVLGGYTSVRREIDSIVEIAERIAPDRVQLNTVTRPPAENYAAAVPMERMREIALCFNPPAEIIAEYRHDADRTDLALTRDAVLNTLRRRPCSVEDIASGLGIHRNEAIKYLEELLSLGQIDIKTTGGTVYYRVTR